MSTNWPVDLPSGHRWFVGSWAVFHGDTAAQVIIPVEQVEGLSNEQIGAYVRELLDTARECNAEETADDIITSISMGMQSPDRFRNCRERIVPYAHKSERIARAIRILDGTEPAPRPEAKSLATRKTQPGWIYLLMGQPGQYKIGLSKQLPSRLKSFGLELPFKVELIHTISTDNMYGAEKALHNTFAERRINGEWFALDPEEVQWICAHETL